MAKGRARQLAKRDLVAQAVVVANVYEKAALDIRAVVGEMLEKGMTERDMVEQVMTLALSTPHEAPLAELWAKLSTFEVNDR